MLQKEWTGEEGIQREDQRSGAWILLPTGIVHLGWNGTNCHSCLSTSYFHDGRETWWAIQRNPLLAEVSTELLATLFSNSMPAWGLFITRTTGSVWCSQLDLLGRSSPYGLHLTCCHLCLLCIFIALCSLQTHKPLLHIIYSWAVCMCARMTMYELSCMYLYIFFRFVKIKCMIDILYDRWCNNCIK